MPRQAAGPSIRCDAPMYAVLLVERTISMRSDDLLGNSSQIFERVEWLLVLLRERFNLDLVTVKTRDPSSGRSVWDPGM